MSHSAGYWPQAVDKDDALGDSFDSPTCYSPAPAIPQRSRQRPNRSIDSTQSFETAHSTSLSVSTRDSAVFSSNDNSTVPSPQQLDREWPDPHWDLKTPTLESFQDAFQPRTHAAALDEPFSSYLETASATTETDSPFPAAPRIPAPRLHIPPSIYVPETLPLNSGSPQTEADCSSIGTATDPFAIPQHTNYYLDRSQHRHLSHNFNLDDYRYDNYDDTRDFVIESDEFSLTDSASLKTTASPRAMPKRRLEKELPPLPPLDENHVSTSSGLNKRMPPGRQQQTLSTQSHALGWGSVACSVTDSVHSSLPPPLPQKDALNFPSSPSSDVHRALQFKDPFLTPRIDRFKLRDNTDEMDRMSLRANDEQVGLGINDENLPSGYRSMDPYLRDSYIGNIQGDHQMEKSCSSSEDEIQTNTATLVIIKKDDERQESVYLDPSEYYIWSDNHRLVILSWILATI